MTSLRRAAGLLALAAIASFAQDKPNFTGDWKLNKAKSELGMMADRIPEDFVIKVEHKDPELKIVNPGMRGGTQESKITTDGKQTVSKRQGQMGEVTAKSVAKWDGEALTVTTNVEMGNNTMDQSERWTLAKDGKTLTIQRKSSTPMGEFEVKQVLEKQ